MFITFEGPEGAGKSTAIRTVAAQLEQAGFQVLVTREPGAGDFGKKIREILLHGDNVHPHAELLLFLADRANHVATIIRPALEEGKVVLCDRYADSTYVYQGIVRGLDKQFVTQGNHFATGGLQPTTTFLLDLPAEIGLSRLESKDRMDALPLEFHQGVRNGFLQLAQQNPDRWQIVDATQTPQEVVQTIFAKLIEQLSNR